MALLLVIYSSRATFLPLMNEVNIFKIVEDSLQLKYPIQDQNGDFINNKPPDNINLKNPSNIVQKVDYDPTTNKYILTETIGGNFYRNPTYMSFDEYLKYEYDKQQTDYWKQRNNANSLILNSNAQPKLLGSNLLIDRLFGPGGVDIRPSGNVQLTFGMNRQIVDNPTLIQAAKKQGGFNFDMNINMNLVGKIGDKLKLTTNYNTQATFDFENQIKLEYTGHEDEIIQSINAGNVSLPLNNSLITGNQTLFGIKTKLKFGRLDVTTVLSQQKSKSEEINIQGGAQTQTFAIQADQYEENKHFFLGQFFHDNYDKWLKKLPIVQSGVNVTRVEVWVTNRTGVVDNVRDVAGFMDLGENKPYQAIWTKSGSQIYPDNNDNTLYQNLKNNSSCRNTNTVVSAVTSGIFINDPNPMTYEKTYGRKLAATEFILYPQLGFISLSQTLNAGDVLAVAYEYTYNGKDYKVGEFSDDVPTVNTTGTAGSVPTSQNVLFLKLLKGQTANTALPMWRWMMKNIYSLGAYQISPNDFKLNVTYLTSGGGEKPYLSEGSVKGIPLLQLLNLDRLNSQNDPYPDGIFDFVPNITIIPQNGRLIFPVIEPFGSDLKSKFQTTQDDQYIAQNYVFQELYDNTKVEAQQHPDKNRFNIKGSYKSNSTSDIYLGAFNLPPGSVKVSSGGQDLKENVDYSVDYNLGRVKILNDGILNSGQPIKIKFENNAFSGLGQVKTFIGNRFDYYINEHMTAGATWLHLSERPFTTNVMVGDDPISNGIMGVDYHFNQQSQFISNILNKLPNYSTKDKSKITLNAEGAKFMPGHSKAIGKNGTVYIDDFEGASSSYDLKFPLSSWALASTPAYATRGATGAELFPESHAIAHDQKSDTLSYGFNRAKLAWYNIDPFFTRTGNGFPSNLTSTTEQSNLFVREIAQTELFPDKQLAPGTPLTFTSFDVYFNPTRKGPYNFDVKGMNHDGTLANPQKRWGGIMRSIDYNDFEAANIEYVEFWMMDPYSNNGAASTNTGDLYFNLGTVSEDILKDGRKFYENGLPGTLTDVTNKQPTIWGFVPTNEQPVTNSFDLDPNVRALQDVGYDGCNDAQEQTQYANYVNAVNTGIGADGLPFNSYVKAIVNADPSNDDYHFYRGSDYDNFVTPILQRYKKFNNAQGNSPTDAQSTESYSTAATNIPETEDINKDNSLSQSESYFQYRVHITPNMNIGSSFINDIRNATVKLADGTSTTVRYYQFKVPINSYEKKVGEIQDFKSIRFVRMYLNGFNDSIIMRFPQLQFTRNQWRKYPFSLAQAGEQLPSDHNVGSYFNVTAVSVEENSSKQPVGYVSPPGVIRQQQLTTQANVLQNEQSIDLHVCGLADGDAKAVYKNLGLDMRTFQHLQEFVHCESVTGNTPLNNHDLYAFIRFGTDFTDNYYEYAIPLNVTPAGATDPSAVWPDANNIDMLLDSMTGLKEKRIARNKPNYAAFSVTYANGIVLTVKGTPDLGMVKTIMLGVRNPQKGSIAGDNDDGQSKCAEVWFDELRLSGFDEQGGYAALIRADLKLADLGSITVTGGLHTIGYGALEQKLAQRFKDNFYQYNIAGNLDFGKLFPKWIGLKLPLYASTSEQFSNPQYDPYQLDVKLKDELAQAKALRGKTYADSIKKVAQDYVGIKSWNLTNVRINRPKKTALGKLNLPTNIENFNISYSYTETSKHNPTYVSDVLKKYKGGIGYNYAIKPKPITPFAWFHVGGKWTALIRDLNFNPLPSNISFKADADRQYGESHLRKFNSDDLDLPPTFNKYFNMSRNYGLKYEPAKSITVDFNATNLSRIDEPYGRIDTKAKQDTIIQHIEQLKRTVNYNQTCNVNYNLPFSKIPLLDWITSRATYGATYTWTTAPLAYTTLGNTIQNTQNEQLNGEFNFNNLYNKIGFLKRYNTKTLLQQSTADKGKEDPNKKDDLKKDDKNAKAINKADKKQKKKDEPRLNPIVYTILKPLMSLKRITANISEDNGTVLPGYMRSTRFLGMDSIWNQPGFGFLAGQQMSPNYLYSMAGINALSADPTQFSPFTQRHSEKINITVQLEPITDMKVDLTFTRTYTRNLSENFKRPDSMSNFAALSKVVNGSFSVSFIALNTFFDKVDKNGVSSLFTQFENKRTEISKKLGTQNPFSQVKDDSFPAYYKGYGPYSQAVLIPAFLATYANPNLQNSSLNDLFKILPKPNWRVNYTGLSKIPLLKKYINQATITHAYNSTFNVGSFMTNPDFVLGSFTNGNLQPIAVDSLNRNFINYFNVPMMSITENFSPLAGIDVTWKNNLTTKVEYKRSRMLNMSFIDYQLSETRAAEITVGVGYKKKGLVLPVRYQNKKVKLDNDLTFRLDLSYRSDRTVDYKLDQNINVPTKGMKSYGISPYISYAASTRVNVKIFYDYRRTIPVTSSSFPITAIKAGIDVRFSLAPSTK